MRVADICTREVVQCDGDANALDVAQLMLRDHVGDVVVTEKPNGERVPIGMVTDRDLVLAVMALERDPLEVRVSDIMGKELVTAAEENDAFEVAELMQFKGVRRIPVVNEQGGLVGIVALDDLLRPIGEQLALLGRVMARARFQEGQARS